MINTADSTLPLTLVLQLAHGGVLSEAISLKAAEAPSGLMFQQAPAAKCPSFPFTSQA